MLGGGGADVPKAIGARRGHSNSRPAESIRAPPGATACALQPAVSRRNYIGHSARTRQQQRQRSRPELSISRCACSGTPSTNPSSIARDATCTITGSHAGLDFAAKIFSTAAHPSHWRPTHRPSPLETPPILPRAESLPPAPAPRPIPASPGGSHRSIAAASSLRYSHPRQPGRATGLILTLVDGDRD